MCMWYHQDWQVACCAQIKLYMCDEKKIVGQGAVLKTRRVKHSADFYRYR
uniref:Uncharacterized protein n=1 Tax=Hyaloperonospora arabidopsidis (strain Emoy2) TaxID=559515 RepID=M4BU18_HYAAE